MQKTIGITGAAGQLGYLCQLRLRFHHKLNVLAIERGGFSDPARLAEFVRRCDAIVHLAGVNRGSEDEVSQGNPQLAAQLVAACRTAAKAPHIVFASSIQVDNGSVYGESKSQAGRILADFCKEAGSNLTEVVFPNLFGEFSRPNYNNFTGTFCHQIANGAPPNVHQDSPVELMHYVDAADVIADAILRNNAGKIRPHGTATSVGTVASKLVEMAKRYSNGTIPPVADAFDLRLFNVYRQVLYPRDWPRNLVRHADCRGFFFECIREFSGGQTSYSTTVPGITRGDHFHFFKVERFIVLAGTARISIRKVLTGELMHFDVSGDAPVYIDMPTLHTHSLTNTGSGDLLTMFWSNDHFDPANPDTYVEPVNHPEGIN